MAYSTEDRPALSVEGQLPHSANDTGTAKVTLQQQVRGRVRQWWAWVTVLSSLLPNGVNVGQLPDPSEP